MANTRTYLGASALLYAEATDHETGEPYTPSSVNWRIIDPNGVQMMVPSLPLNPAVNQVAITTAPGGVATYPGPNTYPGPSTSVYSKLFSVGDVNKWDGLQWNNVGTISSTLVEGEAELIIPPTAFSIAGLYRAVADFTMPNGLVVSDPLTLEIVDPLEVITTTGMDAAVDHTLIKLEDLFDSELGGPWLRDETKNAFDRRKILALLPDALYMINYGYQPTTSFDETNFPTNHYPLVSQALLVEVIFHLIRSYTEQPLPGGGNISWFDRRDYMQRWQSVLEKEAERLTQYIDIFKMEYTGFGATAVLVGGYATPITRMSRYWRMRNPKYIGPWT